MSCHSCTAFEAFTEQQPSPPPQQRGQGSQGCIYTAQGDIVCQKGHEDPFFKSPQMYSKPPVEGFMMRAGTKPQH
jgi:hypothetical protein